MKKLVHFCKWFQLCQSEEGQRKPSSYLFKTKMEGTVNVFDTFPLIAESTMGMHIALRRLKLFLFCFLNFFYPILWPFPDGWWLLRVIWSESDTARVRWSPPAHNKTWERHTTMERSWWRTFASYWPPPSQLGPPSQAWPVAPSNPMQHLHIPKWWIGAHSPSFHWHTQPCTFGLRSRGEVVFAVWTQPTIKQLTAGTQNHDLGPELWGNLHRFACSRATSDVSVVVAINVM